jgi:hypothetical protein
LETLTFHARNWAEVIPNALSTVAQVSLVTTSYHLLQLQTVPDCVGRSAVVWTDLFGGVLVVFVLATAAVPTQYESPVQKLVSQSEETAGYG